MEPPSRTTLSRCTTSTGSTTHAGAGPRGQMQSRIARLKSAGSGNVRCAREEHGRSRRTDRRSLTRQPSRYGKRWAISHLQCAGQRRREQISGQTGCVAPPGGRPDYCSPNRAGRPPSGVIHRQARKTRDGSGGRCDMCRWSWCPHSRRLSPRRSSAAAVPAWHAGSNGKAEAEAEEAGHCVITASWMTCSKCGKKCDEYRCEHRKEPSPTGEWIRTVCLHCRRFIGYRPIEIRRGTHGKNQPT